MNDYERENAASAIVGQLKIGRLPNFEILKAHPKHAQSKNKPTVAFVKKRHPVDKSVLTARFWAVFVMFQALATMRRCAIIIYKGRNN